MMKVATYYWPSHIGHHPRFKDSRFGNLLSTKTTLGLSAKIIAICQDFLQDFFLTHPIYFCKLDQCLLQIRNG